MIPGLLHAHTYTVHDKYLRVYTWQEIVLKSRFQTNVNNLWSGNETMCVYAYTVGKWHPLKQAAAAFAVNGI